MPSLMVDIAANVAGLRRDMDQANRTVTGFTRDVKSSMRTIQTAFYAVGGGYAIKSFISGLWDAGVAAEKMRLGLKAALGTTEEAADAQKYLAQESERLGLVFEDQIHGFTQLAASAKGTALEGKAVRDVWLAIAEAGGALQLSGDQVRGAITALSQMISKGKVSAEELRQQLGERLPGAFQVAAKAMGVTTMELDKMLSQGKLLAEDFLPKFAVALREQYGEAAVDAAGSAQASLNRLVNTWQQFTRDMGEVFIPVAQKIVDFLNENMIPAFEGLSLAIGKSDKALLQRRRMDIIDELEELERVMQGYSKSFMGIQVKGPLFGPSDEDIEEAKQRYASLNTELMRVSLEINQQPILGGGAGATTVAPPAAADEAAAKAMARLEERAEMEMWKVRETLQEKTEMELFMEEELNEKLAEMRESRLEMETGFATSAIELRQYEHDEVLRIAQMQAEQEIAIEEYKNRMKGQTTQNWVRFAGQMFSALYALSDKNVKALFYLERAAAVAEAIVQAHLAYAMALASPPGPPWTVPYAKSILALGLANAGVIAATAIGQGPGGAGAGGAGGAVGTYPASPSGVPEIRGEGGEERATLTINVQGDFIGDEGYIEMLAEKISEAVEDRDVRLIASDSRFAERLR